MQAASSVGPDSERFHRLSDDPVPIWIAGADVSRRAPKWADPGIKINGKFCHFRGVSLDRLPTILKTGIDVAPTDSPIYAGDFDKAFEYGGSPKAVMALDMDRLEPSFRILSTDMPSAEIENLRQDYPYAHEVGDRTWLSRVSDPNLAVRGYEQEYGYWIPGDSFDALQAVYIFCEPDLLVQWAKSLADRP